MSALARLDLVFPNSVSSFEARCRFLFSEARVRFAVNTTFAIPQRYEKLADPTF